MRFTSSLKTKHLLCLLMALLTLEPISFSTNTNDTANINALLSSSEFLRKKNPDSALVLAQTAKRLSEKINFIQGLTYANLREGQANFETGKYTDALKLLLKSKEFAERTKNYLALGLSLNSIGNVYFNQRDLDAAKNYYSQALDIGKREKQFLIVGHALNNLGRIAFEKADYETAEKYFLEGLQNQEHIQNYNGMALGYLNLGLTYYDQKKYYEALANYLKVLEVYKNRTPDKDLLISTNGAIAVYYEERKDFKRSIEYLNESLRLALEAKNKKLITEVYKVLSDNYASAGDFKKSLDYHRTYANWLDSLKNESNTKAFREVQVRYESEKKDVAIDHLNKVKLAQQQALNKEKIIRNLFIGGSALLLLLLFFIYKIYRQKKLSNSLLIKKNIEIEKQKRIIERKNENIIDSINYAKHIQESIRVREEGLKPFSNGYFVFERPKDIVSGDFYWFAEVENKFVIIVADCTGHGVPGAFMSVIGNMLLNEIVKIKGITAPGEILSTLHAEICRSLQQHQSRDHAQDGMAVSVCVFTKGKNEFEFAGANHSICVSTKNKIELITPNKFSIGGLLPGEGEIVRKFDVKKVPFEKNCFVYMYSDGYADQFGGPDRFKFTSAQMRILFEEINKLPTQQQRETIETRFNDWKGKNSQIDDVLILGFSPCYE